MNIGLIGSGGREHALCQKIYESKLVKRIFCLPGNAGTSKLATNLDVDILNFKSVFKIIKNYKIDVVVIGPEEPLVKGLVNYLNKKKVKVFGPNKYAAKLEGSKAFMKKLCKEHKIPTANFQVCINKKQILSFLNKNKLPIVVKADGLAAGKGVTICKSKKRVLDISKEIFKGKFRSSRRVVLEEFLSGEEASYFLIVDKYNFKFFGTAQDHKRVGENDKGLNTGGMGAYSPAPIISKKIEKKIINKIVKPTLNALKNKNNPYKGFLYVGLMIKNGEPFLIEYNVRMGDPECQVILPRLKNDIMKVILNSINDNLKRTKINWKIGKCMTIVLCSKGYPKSYKKNIIIKNLKRIKLDKNSFLFHAGTRLKNQNIYAVGGRVLNFTVIGDNFHKIRKKIIYFIKVLNWRNGFFRKDIGWKIIKK